MNISLPTPYYQSLQFCSMYPHYFYYKSNFFQNRFDMKQKLIVQFAKNNIKKNRNCLVKTLPSKTCL